jgi:hypothetical protein
MRIVIAALAAAAVAGLAFSADAAPANKKKQKHAANKERVAAQRNAAPPTQDYGYDAVPEHYRVGTREWWLAMDRAGRGGCCGNP